MPLSGQSLILSSPGSAPISDADSAGGTAARQKAILEIVGQSGYATIESLAAHFGVSAQTIRRDIIALDKQKLLQRFRGGAGARENTVRLGYTEKRARNQEGKAAIGRIAAEHIGNGDSLFLDVGTTVEAVALAITGLSGLRVVTTSLASAMILAECPEIEVVVTGGTVRGADGSLIGATTVEAIRQFRFDHAVLGFSGIDDDGAPMDFDLAKIAVKRAALERARHCILVGDHSKFARPALARICEPAEVGLLITDRPVEPAMLETLHKAGVTTEFAAT
ncbi:DeoR/GlpR family DNA-binding transcription regulator [Oceanibaculum indicum]|uniref:DeoR family glycerol-3-phosphate regulon repressor n=1 Tax=Oceanibaculum indicum TaxID=526216 RepID=A0A420WMP2_9PROT|nr:DeoR/GlpR family DNA-binding transcription regulator [Oceanibaculum indicum]RKQ72294.1 DeoR family glycerol-3-phosphate regulon repressor [Oceanibaculum indicum]